MAGTKTIYRELSLGELASVTVDGGKTWDYGLRLNEMRQIV